MRSINKIFGISIFTFLFFLSLSNISVCLAESFAFLADGDTRPDVYLPYNKLTKEELQPIVNRAHRNWKHELVYDSNDCLEKLVLTNKDKTQVLYYFKHYWPQKIVLYQTGKKPVQSYAVEGNKWVVDQMIKEMNSGEYDFAINTGDLVFNGLQGNTLKTSPYWQLIRKDFLNNLTDPMKFFPVLGNHEYYQDPTNIGFRETFPWLKNYGFNVNNRIYSFIHKNSLFVFLDSGPITHKTEKLHWNAKHPDFKGQMTFLKQKLDAAKTNSKIKHVFVTYHDPSFSIFGSCSLKDNCNPHFLLQKYSDDFNIVVLNGHSHTTQQYYVDKINYVILGDGGAPKTTQRSKYPSTEAELFWRGKNIQLMYNYLCIYVKDDTLRGEFKCFLPPETLQIKEAFYMELGKKK